MHGIAFPDPCLIFVTQTLDISSTVALLYCTITLPLLMFNCSDCGECVGLVVPLTSHSLKSWELKLHYIHILFITYNNPAALNACHVLYDLLYFQALSDLVVRQKQVTFGLPSCKEHVITQPLSPEDIAVGIESVCTWTESSVTPDKHDKYRAISPHCMLHQVCEYYSSINPQSIV